jgi:hypothetical protein
MYIIYLIWKFLISLLKSKKRLLTTFLNNLVGCKKAKRKLKIQSKIIK